MIIKPHKKEKKPLAPSIKREKDIPMGYSRQREINNYWQTPENNKDKRKNNTDTTPKTKKQMNNMDPTKKPGVDSGAPVE